MFYSFEMVLVGIILLGAMGAAGAKIWYNRKKEALEYQKSLENKESFGEPP